MYVSGRDAHTTKVITLTYTAEYVIRRIMYVLTFPVGYMITPFCFWEGSYEPHVR